MKSNHTTVIACDPGIANTGIAVVQSKSQVYQLKSSQLVRSKPTEEEPNRLLRIHNAIVETLSDNPDTKAVAIESVFHNNNITSSITTGKVIGVIAVAAAQADLPVIYLTPQQIKSVSGLGRKTSKANMLKMASRIFNIEMKSHHTADAALAGIAGILQYRISQGEKRNGKA